MFEFLISLVILFFVLGIAWIILNKITVIDDDFKNIIKGVILIILLIYVLGYFTGGESFPRLRFSR